MASQKPGIIPGFPDHSHSFRLAYLGTSHFLFKHYEEVVWEPEIFFSPWNLERFVIADMHYLTHKLRGPHLMPAI
jgi:hypothetical protein